MSEESKKIAAEPVEDVVGEMLDVWFDEDMPENQDDRRKCMTRSLAVARKGYVKLADVEKAIRAVWKEHYHSQAVWSKEEFLSKLMARLAPKPSLERVTVEEVHTTPLNFSANCAFTVMLDGKSDGPLFSKREWAECYAAGLRAELAALVERRTK